MVHCYSLNGYFIALDVFSGSVHLCDEESLEAVRLYESKSREETKNKLLIKFQGRVNVNVQSVEEILDELDALRDAGKLYTQDHFKLHADKLRQKSDIKALCLHVAHACNLACSYCFAGQGNYQGRAALMSLDVGKKALDYLVQNAGEHRHLEVDFFGGEPLLNWPVVKDLVRYGRELEKIFNKVFRFTLTTNGVLLDDEVTEFLNREMYNVVLSLDGRQAVHDRFRKDRLGAGSYSAVVPRFRRFVELRGDKSYYMRGTYTHYNTDFFKDIIHMADLGFTQLSMEPVVVKPGDKSELTREDLPVLFEQYEKLAAEMLKRYREGRGFDFYHYNIDLEHGPCVYKRLSGCGSGTEYMAVTPWGDLYPCHQFVGEEEFKLGDVFQGVTATALREDFRHNHVYAHPECEDCWAKLYCAGGCAANACHAAGSIHGVYAYGCELFKKRIECAIMLKAALTEAS
jgi:uncharacterized protein